MTQDFQSVYKITGARGVRPEITRNRIWYAGIQIIIGFGSPARARADDGQINRISNAAKSAQSPRA